jgi:copper chaperone CopZ
MEVLRFMEKRIFEVPAMYGDHHVSEVRRILLEIPGVEDVYASSAFRIVEVSFDPNITSEQAVDTKMQEAGYMGEWLLNTESGKAVGSGIGSGTFMRHTMVNEQVKQVVGFAQKVGYQGRPLWPCPGMGPINGMDEEKQ